MNIILLLIEIIISFIFLLIFYKKYKQNGLYLYGIITFILALLTSVKNIEIIGMDIPLGIVLITTLYAVSNILVQKNGVKATNKLISYLLITCAITIPIVILYSSIIPSGYTSIINNSYSQMFIDKLRIVLATTFVSFLSLWLNSIMYYQLKRDKNNLLISNLLSLIIIYFIDASLFGILSFIFVIPISRIFITIAIIYTMKLIVGLVGIIVAYIARDIKDK